MTIASENKKHIKVQLWNKGKAFKDSSIRDREETQFLLCVFAMILTSIENLLAPIQMWFNYSLWQKLSKEEKKFSLYMKQHLKANDKCFRE